MSAEILKVDPQDPEAAVVDRAVAVLNASRLLVYPTDTLYAVGGLALVPGVSLRVREVKGRPSSLALPVIAGSIDQARSLIADWPAAATRLAARFWPGPLSLVLPARAGLPEALLAGAKSLAVRVPACALARRLALAAGPLISTSANRSGEPAASTCAQALASLAAGVELALDGGPGRAEPSTLIDLCGSEPRLLRPGALPWEDVLASLS